MVTEALNPHCLACLETRRGGTMQVPHSVGSKPAPWQNGGHGRLAMCLVMRLIMVELQRAR